MICLNVKGLLENYFKKISFGDHMEKLAAKRAVGSVIETNKKLAESLKSTAYAECNAGNEQSEKIKNICLLQHEKIDQGTKLELIQDLLTKENFLVYIPYVNKVIKNLDKSKLKDSELSILKSISNNQTVKKQLFGIAEKALGLAFKKEILDLNEGLGYISKQEVQDTIRKEFYKILSKPLTVTQVDSLCSMGIDHDILKNIKVQDFKASSFGHLEVRLTACLDLRSPEFVKKVLAVNMKPNDEDLQTLILDYLETGYYENPDKITLPPLLHSRIQKLIADPENRDWGLSLVSKFQTPNQQSIAVAKKFLSSKDHELNLALEHLAIAGDIDERTVKIASDKNDSSCSDCAIILMNAKKPEATARMIEVLKTGNSQDKAKSIKYLQDKDKLSREFQQIIADREFELAGFGAESDHMKLLKLEKFDSDLREKLEKIKNKKGR